MTEITAEQIDRRVALGPVNRWWPIAASWMLTDKPMGLTRLGEKIAVWRELQAAGVDLINTDDLPGLQRFLSENSRN